MAATAPTRTRTTHCCWIDPLGLSNADYVPPPEVAACGPLQAPWETRPGELDIDADIRVVLPGSPMVLDPNETDRYLYAIGPDGTVYYSPQSPQAMGSDEIVKHTTIAGEDPDNPGKARPMRVAGEINYDPASGQWIMDGNSGRYSYDARTRRERTPDNVAAAAALANAEPAARRSSRPRMCSRRDDRSRNDENGVANVQRSLPLTSDVFRATLDAYAAEALADLDASMDLGRRAAVLPLGRRCAGGLAGRAVAEGADGGRCHRRAFWV